MLRKRYRQITSFFTRVILRVFFYDILLPRIGMKGFSQNGRSRRFQSIATKFRDLAVDMGGVMIKVGQFLSSRVDMLPLEVTKELAGLQDEVKPEPFTDIRIVAEKELGGPLESSFLHFDENPMASASLGQVHRAQLQKTEKGIQDVVVKIQRPNIENIIATDLSALRTVGKWMQRFPPIRKRADVNGLLDEFSKITYQEIDYLSEGKNAETFAANFEGREEVRVPEVIWSVTTKRVLTLENVQAIKITDYQAITKAGISRAEVAQRLFHSYLKQIFEDGFFHADPHPGNLFVDPRHPSEGDPQVDKTWVLNFVDFGMVGRVPDYVREGLREMAIGVGTKDSERIVNSYKKLGVLLPDADLNLIRKMESKAFEQFWGKSMSDLQKISWDEMHGFAKEFQEVIFDLPFQIPSDLLFLGRCVAILAGMCTGLNPDFNVWEGLEPFAAKLIRDEAQIGWQYWRDEAVGWGRMVVGLPQRLDSFLRRIERGELEVDTPSLNRQAARLEKTGRKLLLSFLFGVLFFSGVQIYLANLRNFGIVLIVFSLLPLFRVIFFRD